MMVDMSEPQRHVLARRDRPPGARRFVGCAARRRGAAPDASLSGQLGQSTAQHVAVKASQRRQVQTAVAWMANYRSLSLGVLDTKRAAGDEVGSSNVAGMRIGGARERAAHRYYLVGSSGRFRP